MTGRARRFPESFAELEKRTSEVWRRHRMLVSLVYVGALVGFVGGCLLAQGLLLTNPRDDSLILAGSGALVLGLLIALGSNIFLQRARIKERSDSSG